MPEGELILYTTEDGLVEISMLALDGKVWLTKAGEFLKYVAQKLAAEPYDEFESKRRTAGALANDKVDIVELELIAGIFQGKKNGGGDE